VEDKMFELMEKFYNEFTGFKQEVGKRFDSVDKRFEGLELGQKNLEIEVKKIQVKIEHKIEPKIQALYEDREIVHSKLDTIENEIKKPLFQS
jgi:chaperonin cofactor prefoldin